MVSSAELTCVSVELAVRCHQSGSSKFQLYLPNKYPARDTPVRPSNDKTRAR